MAATDKDAIGLHVFCVKPQPAGRIASDGTIKDYTIRKTHRKTRTGCSACKAKRVKCGEERPACSRCVRSETECKYSHSIGTTTPSGSGARASPRQSKKAQPFEIADSMSRLVPLPRAMISSSADLHLLKHYDTITGKSLLIGPEAEQYRNAVLQMAQIHEYLFHALLSLAALHFMESNVPGYRQTKLAHLSLALRHFQDAISKPIAKEDSDAILLTSIMINMQYFSWVDSAAPESSFIHSKDPLRLSWLSVQEGGAALIAKTRPFHSETKILHYFYVKPTPGENLRRLPQALFDLCEVTDEMGPPGVNSNPYHDIVHAIALMMPFEPSINSFIKYLHFSGRVYRPFVKLVEKNDHRALLILAYWFALLGPIDMWWCRQRVKRDCLAICEYLNECGDEAIRSLLEFPANACGYDLGIGKVTLGYDPIFGELDSFRHGGNGITLSDDTNSFGTERTL